MTLLRKKFLQILSETPDTCKVNKNRYKVTVSETKKRKKEDLNKLLNNNNKQQQKQQTDY